MPHTYRTYRGERHISYLTSSHPHPSFSLFPLNDIRRQWMIGILVSEGRRDPRVVQRDSREGDSSAGICGSYVSFLSGDCFRIYTFTSASTERTREGQKVKKNGLIVRHNFFSLLFSRGNSFDPCSRDSRVVTERVAVPSDSANWEYEERGLKCLSHSVCA